MRSAHTATFDSTALQCSTHAPNPTVLQEHGGEVKPLQIMQTRAYSQGHHAQPSTVDQIDTPHHTNIRAHTCKPDSLQ